MYKERQTKAVRLSSTYFRDDCPRIGRYIDDIDEITFLDNKLTQDAVVRILDIIGEASRNMNKHYPEYSEKHAKIPFAVAYEMRNARSHGYLRWTWRLFGKL